MPIGQKLFRKNHRTDLDEYLKEVNQHLFCVSKEDKLCLLRDLKAHVRELTLDNAEKYKGKYKIDTKELMKVIGNPKRIAFDYISSTKIKPSKSMILLLSFIFGMFIYSTVVGFDFINVGYRTTEELYNWRNLLGISMILGSLLLAMLNFHTAMAFEKNLVRVPFFLLCLILISIPVASDISSRLIESSIRIVSVEKFLTFMWVIVIDVFVITLIGLFISIKHLHVKSKKTDLP